MVLYGEPIEEVMRTSSDPVIKKIWDEKEVVQYDNFPFDRVCTSGLFIGLVLWIGAGVETAASSSAHC